MKNGPMAAFCIPKYHINVIILFPRGCSSWILSSSPKTRKVIIKFLSEYVHPAMDPPPSSDSWD